MTVRVGISGWTYPPWRGDFYPKGLPHRRELAFAAERLNSIEINGSFYALQKPASYFSWAAQTPADFVFSVKAGRFITHMKKLRGVESAVANYFGSGLLALSSKLGPVLWQLPPSLPFDPERIRPFLQALPRSTGEAAFMARKHDDLISGRAWTGTIVDRPLRHAMEVRHDSYKSAAFLDLLAEQSIAVVVADTAGKWPQFLDVTADFVYVRLHGDQELYTSGYSDEALLSWAGRIKSWLAGGLDVFVYFDNDVKVRSPYDAMSLRALLEERC